VSVIGRNVHKYVAKGGDLHFGHGGILINSVEELCNVVCTVHVHQLVQLYARTYLYSQAIFRHVTVAATHIIREDNITNQNQIGLVLDIRNRLFIQRPAYVHGYICY